MRFFSIKAEELNEKSTTLRDKPKMSFNKTLLWNIIALKLQKKLV